MEINKIFNEACEDTISRMPKDFIDLTVTSPPYYNAKEYSQYNGLKEYMGIMRNIFLGILNVTKPSRMCIINISPVIIQRNKRSEQSYRLPLPFYFVPMMEEIGWEFLEDIIWKKPEGAAPNRNAKFSKYRKPISYKPNIVTEYILVFKKPAPFLIDKVLKHDSLVAGHYERSNVWEINPETNSNHPAPFPEKLAENCIHYYSYKNDLIYDPFSGSGTTVKMCILNQRNYLASEKIESYYNDSLRRISQLQGRIEY